MTIKNINKNHGTLIALYGVMRKDGNHFFEIDSEHVKHVGVYISKPQYTMYNISDVYPGIIPDGNTSITLDVFRISNLAYEDIIDEVLGYDIMNEENSIFHKHIIDTPFGTSFIYYYNIKKTKEKDKIVESGDWIYHLSPFNKNTQIKYEEKNNMVPT